MPEKTMTKGKGKVKGKGKGSGQECPLHTRSLLQLCHQHFEPKLPLGVGVVDGA